MMFQSFEAVVPIGTIFVVLYFLHRAVLPKPLEGIPYNKDAAKKLFGDVPEMMGYVMRTKRVFVGVVLCLKQDPMLIANLNSAG